MTAGVDHGLPRDSSLGYQVNHLARLMASALRDALKPYGVVPGQFAQLLALYEADGLTQAELCERVRVEQPTMANTLARMQRDGLITRTADPDDGRRSLVILTDKARALEPQLIAAARSVNESAVAGLSAAEASSFMRTLARVIARLESPSAEPSV